MPIDIEQRVKRAELKDKRDRLKLDSEKVKVDKLNALRYLLVGEIPTDTQFGEGTRYKPLFDESQIESLKDKVFKIVHTL
jgi:hypothetical protein